MERFAQSLDGIDQLLSGPVFRERFGVRLSAAERFDRARQWADSSLPNYLKLGPMYSLIFGAASEDERAALASQCNEWMREAPLPDQWVHDGALRAAVRTGRTAAASFGAHVVLNTAHAEALAVAQWLGADPSRLPNVRSIGIASPSGSSAPSVLALIEALGEREIDLLKLPSLDPAAMKQLLSALPSTVRGVDAHYASLGSTMLSSLAKSPAWRSLRTLDLHKNDLKSKGIAPLARAKSPPAITAIDLGYNHLNSADFAALAQARWVRGLRSLVFKYNEAKGEGAEAFFSRADLSSLKALDFGANEIGDAGVAALVQCQSLSSLESLAIEGNRATPLITKRGAEQLAQWPGASTVRTLNLAQNPLGSQGVRALLQSEHWASLGEVDLQYCGLDAAFVRSMAGLETAARPRRVTLTGNPLGSGKFGDAPRSAVPPSQDNPWNDARWLSNCVALNLYGSSIDVDTLAQIVHADALANVRALNVSSNYGLSNAALELVLDSPMGQRLDQLEALYWDWAAPIADLVCARHARRPWLYVALSRKGLDEQDVLRLRCTLGSRLYLS